MLNKTISMALDLKGYKPGKTRNYAKVSKDLAAEMGINVSPEAVRKWCEGLSRPTADKWAMLEKWLGLDDGQINRMVAMESQSQQSIATGNNSLSGSAQAIVHGNQVGSVSVSGPLPNKGENQVTLSDAEL